MTESEAGLSSCCPECVRLLEVTDLALGGEDRVSLLMGQDHP